MESVRLVTNRPKQNWLTAENISGSNHALDRWPGSSLLYSQGFHAMVSVGGGQARPCLRPNDDLPTLPTDGRTDDVVLLPTTDRYVTHGRRLLLLSSMACGAGPRKKPCTYIP